MGVLEDVQALRTKVQGVDRLRAKRQADREVAETRLQEALDALSAEFGVSSVEEAEAKLLEVSGALQSQVAALEADLAEIGA